MTEFVIGSLFVLLVFGAVRLAYDVGFKDGFARYAVMRQAHDQQVAIEKTQVKHV